MKRNQRVISLVLAVLIALVLIGTVAGPRGAEEPPEELSLAEVRTAIEDGKVDQAEVDDARRVLVVTFDNDDKAVTSYPLFYGPDLVELFEDNNVDYTFDPVRAPNPLTDMLFALLPMLLVVGIFLLWMSKKGGLGVANFSKGRGVEAEVPDIRFSDVAGCDEAIEELRELTSMLKEPERFTASGAKIPRGFLLTGPPGTGKTLLARALAGEAGVPFLPMSGSDFVETFVGVGASRMRSLFDRARKHGRAIVFIDEIDAVGKTRAAGPATGANEERESTLNQLLVEMDGFSQSGIIVIGATNRPEVLDDALLRPGRFDRQVTVPAPDRRGRTQLLELYAKGHRFSPDVDFIDMARRTPGLTGAAIANLVNDAAIESVRRDCSLITMDHLEAALAKTVLGPERKSAVITARDREITAWHEAGHTVAALTLDHAEDPVQVTIIPRGPAGGVTWMGGNDNQFMTRSEARAQLVVALAGRAAEELLLDGDFTQGAAGDLHSATRLATDMVTRFGMSGAGLAVVDTHVPDMTGRVEREVNAMLASAMDDARDLIEERRQLLEAVSVALLDEETLRIDDIRRIEANLDVEA